MMTKQHLIERIQAEASLLGIDKCCLQLLDMVLSSSLENPVFTCLHLMQSVQGYSLDEITSSVNYLRASPISLFSKTYQYIDDEGIPYELSADDISAAVLDKALPHPDSGILDSGFMDKVYVVYVGNKSAVES